MKKDTYLIIGNIWIGIAWIYTNLQKPNLVTFFGTLFLCVYAFSYIYNGWDVK